MSEKKKPRGKPFEKGRAKTGGRKKEGRNIRLKIPFEIAATLPDSDAAARAEIIERIKKEKQ